ncbi:hypothetical protein D1822_15220 [Phaeobacter inhibens]|uniref:hypothetical protein n=1 Tax=Phaeobacter inhibens TaxID=221822 RepID=UPI0001632F9F|nr:hypothetical protein [Phaeobacter inhibens]AFO92745.1 hypothetical protein PGA1_c30970 [Phaeobacter inhibens DSM 17395]AUQ47450.1 hypothetical protein PhaeoP10_03146 [Phaeobacter inhibens]AXT24052.1 hypothetical protein D1822_15220 [Phaeobacter inhibens]
MTSTTISMLEVIRFGKDQENGTTKQYAKNLERMFVKRGYKDRHLATLDGTLETYFLVAPKYSKSNAALNAKIQDWGITPSSYKQYQTDGRRMIETCTGDLQMRLARRARQDVFAQLLAHLPDLVEANLVKASQTRNLPRFVDLARARGWDLADLNRDRTIQLREDCFYADEWARVKQGAAFLDYLRGFPTFLPMLPPDEIGSLAGILRVDTQIPEFLAKEAQSWVRSATKVYRTDMLTCEAREATVKQYSKSSENVYSAAIQTYVREAESYADFGSINGLTALFQPELIEKVFIALSKKSGTTGGLAPRSLFTYAGSLKRMLAMQGQDDEAEKVELLIKSLPVLVQGQAASKIMSPKVEAWCRDLLNDPLAMETFETQHLRYSEKAIAAIELAEIEGIDLLAYSRLPQGQPFSGDQARLAEKLLRQARMYGVCAAVAAIELEGAPFRKSNVINDLLLAGHPQTFFDLREDKQRPRLEVHLPNELLKNGEAMTRRGQYMPRFTFEENGLGADGYRILQFYLTRIRPLFGGSEFSDHLFPAIKPENKPLVMSTFDGWLAECSNEIGFFLLPHNFRHGFCSVEIFYDPTCYAELETITGDTEKTLRQHYTFIDRERQSRSLQEKRYERRAQRTSFSSDSKEAMA